MTVLESYNEVLTRLGKKKAASFYPEDFVIFLTNAVYDRVNVMYKDFEKTQLLSDDLQNLQRHVVINLNGNVPFPFNVSYIDGEPFLSFNESLVLESLLAAFHNETFTDLNCASAYQSRQVSKNTDLAIIENTIFYKTGIWAYATLDVLELKSIEDGTIIAIKENISVRNYTYGGNTNKLKYGFSLGSLSTKQCTTTNPGYFRYDSSTEMFNLIDDLGFKDIDGTRLIINAPNDYMHATGLTNFLEYKNSPECEKTFETELGVKRLTAQVRANIRVNSWLRPSLTLENNYFKEMNDMNSVYPKFEILYCDKLEKNLVTLKQVELLYIKEPKKYVLTDADVRSDYDGTESLEFQEYICEEINEQIINMFLERHSNPRVQSFIPVNDSNKATREQK